MSLSWTNSCSLRDTNQPMKVQKIEQIHEMPTNLSDLYKEFYLNLSHLLKFILI